MVITTDPFAPPAEPPDVPGVDLRRLLGRGAHGEVWAGRDQVSGDPVAVKVGPRTAGAQAEAGLLTHLVHPHLLRLHRVTDLSGGRTAMVLDLAAGGSLAALVATRGPLGAGEVGTVLVPVAQALGYLHDRGVAHGDVSPANLLFTREGQPLLGDLGVSRVLGLDTEDVWATPGFSDPAGPGGDPRAGDLYGLAAVGWFALTGRVPGGDDTADDVPAELVDLLRTTLDAAPGARPAPEEFAARAFAAVTPVPVRLVGGGLVDPDGAEDSNVWADLVTARQVGDDDTAPTPMVARPARRRWRTPVVVLAGAALVAGAAVTGIRVLGAREPAPVGVPVAARPVAGPAVGGTAVAPVLQEIASARATAFATGDAAALAGADEPGSPADRADRDLIGRLERAGVRLSGLGYRVEGAEPATVPAGASGQVEVSAVVTTSAHRQTDDAGRVAREVPAEGPRPVRLVLVPAGDGAGWRVRSVEPVDGAGGDAGVSG